jgi:hypothetical protein
VVAINFCCKTGLPKLLSKIKHPLSDVQDARANSGFSHWSGLGLLNFQQAAKGTNAQ